MVRTNRSVARVLGASLVGTAVEFYDFYVYAIAASLVLGPLFFPRSSQSAQLLASYSSFALAFMSRPLGALVFGHFGDRIGRKSTLIVSLLTMGLSTFAIGLLPTYRTLDWLAPLLLCLFRFGQGIGLGGEWGGATLLAVENAPPGFQARFGMFPTLGAPVGFVIANGLFLGLGYLLTPSQFEAWGWRLPFLFSIGLVGVGLWVRLKLTETPAFKAAMAAAPPLKIPIGDALRDCPRETLAGTFAVIVCFAIFYLATAFALGYCSGTLHYDRRAVLAVQLGAIVFMAIGIVLAGFWSDRTSPRRVLLSGCVATFVLGFLLAPALASGSLFVIWLYLSAALFVMGFVYGPLGAFLPALFPARMRYTGVSLTFNVGGILGGGIVPLLAQSLANRGDLGVVGLFLSGAAAISLVAIAASPSRDALPADPASGPVMPASSEAG